MLKLKYVGQKEDKNWNARSRSEVDRVTWMVGDIWKGGGSGVGSSMGF